MPSAPTELQDEWDNDDQKAMSFLRNNGFALTRTWDWLVPKDHTITAKEQSAMLYLVHEWDFGSWVYES